ARLVDETGADAERRRADRQRVHGFDAGGAWSVVADEIEGAADEVDVYAAADAVADVVAEGRARKRRLIIHRQRGARGERRHQVDARRALDAADVAQGQRAGAGGRAPLEGVGGGQDERAGAGLDQARARAAAHDAAEREIGSGRRVA